jgi:multidrug resistance efflux pump
MTGSGSRESMSRSPHRVLLPDVAETERPTQPVSLPRLSVLLLGGGDLESSLRGLARGTYEMAAVPDSEAAQRILATRRVDVLCLGPEIVGHRALDFLAQVDALPDPPEVWLVLAGGPDLAIFQEYVDRSRLFYLSPSPPAPDELDALLRAALRGAAEAASRPTAVAGTLPGAVLVELLRRLPLLDDPEEIGDLVVQAARELLDADRAYFLFFETEKQELWARDKRGSGRRTESAAVGLVSFVLRSGIPVRLARIGDDPRYDRSADDPRARGDERFLAVPVTAAGHELGVLAVMRGGERPELGDREQADLQQLTAQAAPFLAARMLVDRGVVDAEAAGLDPQLFRREVVERVLHPKLQADPLRISPVWARRSYWVLVGALAAFLAYVWLGRIDEYAAGVAVVETGGHSDLTARTAGTVTAVEVVPGQTVAAGQVLVRFDDAQQRAELERSQQELTLQLIHRLRDPASAAAEQALISLRAQNEQARAHLEERLLRAPTAGVVEDVLVRPGQYLQPGQTALSLSAGPAQPTVTAVLPGQIRPQLRRGQPMRLEVSGYRYAYQRLTVDSVGDEVIGPAEAQRTLGPAIAGSLQLTGPVVLVRARLPSATFEADGKTWSYHNGLHGTVEIRVRSERILWVLAPSLKAVFAGSDG